MGGPTTTSSDPNGTVPELLNLLGVTMPSLPALARTDAFMALEASGGPTDGALPTLRPRFDVEAARTIEKILTSAGDTDPNPFTLRKLVVETAEGKLQVKEVRPNTLAGREGETEYHITHDSDVRGEEGAAITSSGKILFEMVGRFEPADMQRSSPLSLSDAIKAISEVHK